ncbi:MAG: hypothetical protein ACC645_25480, partial [Pirellulales bacterium]
MRFSIVVAVASLVTAGLSAQGVVAQSIHVVNPSFQEQDFPVSPGYLGGVSEDGNATNPEAITGWATVSGNMGINPVTGGSSPFHDNGLIPDNNGLLFMQGAGTVTQTLSGFEPGKPYWLQFYVNARSSNGSVGEAGDSGIPNASVFFEGVNLLGDGVFAPINPVEDSASKTLEWTLIHIPVTPTGETADLTFTVDSVSPAPVGGSGDGTLLVDAVSVIQRHKDEAVIQNASFEASGLGGEAPGYQPNIAGWNASGLNIGTQPSSDDSSPFADNGQVPDGTNVVFIQSQQSLEQQINGLEVGQEYQVSFYYNARAGNLPHLLATLGGTTLLDTDVTPVGAAGELNPYHKFTGTFTAADASELLSFSQTAEGDHSVLLDNVSIFSLIIGDMDRDNDADFDDIEAFVLGLNDAA